MIINHKNHFPEREAKERIKDFKEVGESFELPLALKEAERCLQCKHAPCINGCPVNIKIPEFIAAIKQGKLKEAYQIIRHDHFLPSVCGRVCPQERQCEKNCVLTKKHESVAIGKLERFVGDTALKNQWNTASTVQKNNYKAAIVGSGPASIACAGELAKHGIQVTVYESLHRIGGVLIYGIPEFRLPNHIIEAEMQVLKQMGVEFVCDIVIGKTIPLKDLQKDFDAIFLGVGAGTPRFLDIPGEKLNGVFSANEFLTRINLMSAYDFPNYDTPAGSGQRVVVVGGGNTAMDAARTALRMGVQDVQIVYRRSQDELPARLEEVHHAKEEGVKFNFLVNPVEIIGNDNQKIQKVKLQKMELGEADARGRRRPVPIEGEFEELETDLLIIAIGTASNPLLPKISSEIKLNRGYIATDEHLETSIPGIFAGGDIVTGAATVIQALGAGKKAARNILKKLKLMK